MNSNDNTLSIGAPLNGWCDSLDDCPDDVFRQRLLGDGVSLDPTDGKVLAPCDGTVVNVANTGHSITLRADNGAELLIHFGIDTVNLAGRGFESHVSTDDRVSMGQLLLSVDLNEVVRGVPSLRTPVLLLQNERFRIQDVAAPGQISCGDEIYRVAPLTDDAGAAASESESPASLERLQSRVAVGLSHGLHARPAATLTAAIKSLDASVSLINKSGDQADAKSPIALMGLDILHAELVTISASGQDAEEAIRTIESLLEPMDAAGPDGDEPEPEPRAPRVPGAAPAPGSVHLAQPAAAGLARGRTILLREWHPESASVGAAATAAEELQALDAALSRVREFLGDLAETHEGEAREIASVHRILVDDPALQGEARTLIEQGDSAFGAWRRVTTAAATKLRNLDDLRMRERGDDIEDMSKRVLRVIAGLEPSEAVELAKHSIIIADTLLPSQLLELDQDRIAGISTAQGGATSHAAILAASMGIPMLVAAGDPILAVADGTEMLLDSDSGRLVVAPSAEQSEHFDALMAQARQRRARAQQRAGEESRSQDGVLVSVKANIASAEDARIAVESGCDGCGLLRTEFVFMGSASLPTEQSQLEVYQEIADALGDRPLTIRTLDAGADKPIACLNLEQEENPALGVRGIRLCLENREMFESQLRALLRVKSEKPVKVMIPMVSTLRELEQVKEIVGELRSDPSCDGDVEIGVMIETPAAALLADKLAGAAQFFSIGTNDLAQYTLAIDRGIPSLADRLDVLHPSVLKLIEATASAAARADIPVSVCGAAAGDALAAPILLGLGIRELSMVPGQIAEQKERVRGWSIEDCQSLAREALHKESPAEVRALARRFVGADQ